MLASTALAISVSQVVFERPVIVAFPAFTFTFPAFNPSALIVVPSAFTLVTFNSLSNATVYSFPPSAFVPSSRVRFSSPSANFTVVCFPASPATSFNFVALATSESVTVFPSVSFTE